MARTYYIERGLKGWHITLHAEMVGAPTRIGGPYQTRKAALVVARLLAGHRDSVEVKA